MCTPAQLPVICKFNKQTLSWSLMKILNITRLQIDPCRNPAGVSLHFDSGPLVTTFWVLFSKRLCSHCIVRLCSHSSRPHFLSLAVRKSGERASENLLRSRYMTEVFLCCPQDLFPFYWRKLGWFDIIFLDKCMLPVSHLLVILQVLKSSLVICPSWFRGTKAKLSAL